MQLLSTKRLLEVIHKSMGNFRLGGSVLTISQLYCSNKIVVPITLDQGVEKF